MLAVDPPLTHLHSYLFMSDTTDTVLAAILATGLSVCGLGLVIGLIRATCWRPRMKQSRSDPDLESLQELGSDSLPTHK